MALPTGGYSFTPQVANLGASPLSALKPLDVGVSVQFTPMPKYEVPSAQQELVSIGAAKGFQGLVEPAFAALKAKEEKKQERAHEVTIANIKAAPTEAEKAYALLKNTLTQKQIDATTARIQDATEGIDSTAVEAGGVDFSPWTDFTNQVPEVPIPAATPVSPAPSASDVPPASTPASTDAAFAPNPQTPAQNAIIALQRNQKSLEDSKQNLVNSFAKSVKWEADKALKENNIAELERLAGLGAINDNALTEYKTYLNSVKRNENRLAEFNNPTPSSVASTNIPKFAPADAGRGLFQFDQTTPIDESGNVIPPKENIGIVDTASQPNLFSNINNLSISEQQVDTGNVLSDYNLAPPKPREVVLPEPVATAKLQGVSLPLVPVSGAEEKPLAGTLPPSVEPALPQAQPALAATQQPVRPTQLTQSEYDQAKYQVESQLIARPYKSLADARMAKQIVERVLGVKAQISTEKGEKGSRLHYVEILEAPTSAPTPPKTPPEGFFTKKITDADGKETYVYEPKIPVKQQIATFDKNIDKAKILKETLQQIEEIAPGYLFAGAGGISGLMKYNPFANDAKTTRALLDTVKGIVGFDELVALKAQGGTLGALSDKELDMLTSLKGSINPDMNEATFLKNIKSMRESTERLIAGLETDKKEVMKVESPTKFQSIQSEKPKYEKGVTSFVKDGYKYVWDGTEFKLSK